LVENGVILELQINMLVQNALMTTLQQLLDNTPTADSAACSWEGWWGCWTTPSTSYWILVSSSSSGFKLMMAMDVWQSTSKRWWLLMEHALGQSTVLMKIVADDLINYRGCCSFVAIHEQAHGAKMPCSQLWQYRNQRNTSMSTASAAMERKICHSTTKRQSAPGFLKNYTKGQLKNLPWVSANVADRTNHMMNQWRKWKYKKLFSVLLGFTVLKTICAPCGGCL